MAEEGVAVTFEFDKAVGGRTIRVLPSTILMSTRRNSMVQRATEEPNPDADVQLLRVLFYPALAACSQGEIPSEAQFLSMDERDADKWYKTVMAVNPHWFGFLDEKKTGSNGNGAKPSRKRPRSGSKKGVKKPT